MVAFSVGDQHFLRGDLTARFSHCGAWCIFDFDEPDKAQSGRAGDRQYEAVFCGFHRVKNYCKWNAGV